MILSDDYEPELITEYQLCEGDDLTGVDDSAIGYQRIQKIPNSSWTTDHTSTGLRYLGGEFTYGQTGIFV